MRRNLLNADGNYVKIEKVSNRWTVKILPALVPKLNKPSSIKPPQHKSCINLLITANYFILKKKINLYKMQELHFDMFDVILNDYVLWYIAKDFLCLRADHPVQQSGHLWFTLYSCNLWRFSASRVQSKSTNQIFLRPILMPCSARGLGLHLH